MRTPTKAELKTFCERDNWTPQKRTDHWKYSKEIDGKWKETRVSFGSGQIGGHKLFAHILRDQLQIDFDEFWRVVDEGGPARRPTPVIELPAPELPAWIEDGLLREGVAPEEIEKLDEQNAHQLLEELWSRSR